MKYYTLVLYSLLLISCASVKESTNIQEIEKKIHTSMELFQIMEKSTITYNIDLLDEDETIPFEAPDPLHNQFYIINEDSTLSLLAYELSNTEHKVYMDAENSFSNGEYTIAIEQYEELYNMKPEYAYALTMIGDCYYNMDDLKNAKLYFRKAIKQNPIDYSAYWFLADSYLKEGNLDSANYSITRAHILNKYNPTLYEKMIFIKEEIEVPWKNWNFHPQYNLEKTKKGVKIKTGSEWMGYAFAKAIWAYEPGYYESITGEKREGGVANSHQEKEAVLSLLSHNDNLPVIVKIIEDGYFDEFFYYEIVANQAPVTLLLTSEDQRERIVEYLFRYH